MVRALRRAAGFVHGDCRCGLDARVANPYLTRMTSRLFLTLLAIITGLSVQGSEVQARANSARTTEIGAVLAVASVNVTQVTASAPTIPEEVVEASAPTTRVLAPQAFAFQANTVESGVDRARE